MLDWDSGDLLCDLDKLLAFSGVQMLLRHNVACARNWTVVRVYYSVKESMTQSPLGSPGCAGVLARQLSEVAL